MQDNVSVLPLNFPWFLSEFSTQQATGELARGGKTFLGLEFGKPGVVKNVNCAHLTLRASLLAHRSSEDSRFHHFPTEHRWASAQRAPVWADTLLRPVLVGFGSYLSFRVCVSIMTIDPPYSKCGWWTSSMVSPRSRNAEFCCTPTQSESAW